MDRSAGIWAGSVSGQGAIRFCGNLLPLSARRSPQNQVATDPDLERRIMSARPGTIAAFTSSSTTGAGHPIEPPRRRTHAGRPRRWSRSFRGGGEAEPGASGEVILDEAAVLGVGDRDGARRGELRFGLVEAAEAGEGPRPGLMGVRQVEVGEPGRGRRSPRRGRRGASAASPWPSTAWARETSQAARAAFSGPRPGGPPPVVRRGVGPAEQVVDLVRSQLVAAEQLPGRVVGVDGQVRCSSPSASSAATALPSPGARPASGSPVSSSDFRESRIHGHPRRRSPTCRGLEREVAVDRRDPR